MRLVERLPRLFLLEQVGNDVAPGGQPDLVAFDFGNQAARDEMMMLLMTHAAVGADQLDAVLFDAVDRADMHAVGADHFHMLADILEAAHETFSSLGMPVQRFVHAAGSRPP